MGDVTVAVRVGLSSVVTRDMFSTVVWSLGRTVLGIVLSGFVTRWRMMNISGVYTLAKTSVVSPFS